MTTDDDDDSLEAAQRRRDDAYEARNARGDNAWRNPGQLDPSRADFIERQAERWRGGR
jgi:hypothetical protein